MKKNVFRSFFLILALLCQLLSGCGTADDTSGSPIVKSGFYFNTVISITLYDSSKEQLLDDCFDMAETYENYFSNTVPDSDISKINAAEGAPVAVHEETLELLETGLSYCELSNGKFDITIGRLSDLWDFSTKALIEESYDAMVPSPEEIKEALSTVDYHCVQINGNEVSLSNPDARLDLGGIAKGYIADRMKAYLNENGVTSGYINLGGNVLVLGAKPDGSSYNIGIQKPFDEDGASIAAVRVTDETVVSSGVYERCFTVNGVLYHHILDTSTGYPYDNGLLGVTIITKASVDGDGLSTTCFALGLEDGMALIESLPDTEAVFITDDYELHTSSGLGTEIPFQELE
jgi:thiamine biosynthesis lipoprotein